MKTKLFLFVITVSFYCSTLFAQDVTSYGGIEILGTSAGNNGQISDSFFGEEAGLLNGLTGVHNTFIGYRSGYQNTIAIGDQATVEANEATAIGNGASATGVNSTAIGNGAIVSNDNEITLGNAAITSINAYVPALTDISDGRFKTDIREDVSGLAFIKRLRPVSYQLERTQIHKFLTRKDAPQTTRNERSMGFVAQEVEQVIKEHGYVFTGLKRPKNEKDHYGLRYAEFVVPLTKAVQELNTLVETQQQLIETQQQQNEALQDRIEALESLFSNDGEALLLPNTDSIQNKDTDIEGESFVLYQNVPNPFDKTTVISAVVPENINKAKIIVYNLQGLELESYDINQRGNVAVEISGGRFPSGMYLYALIADGQVIDTKKMILTR